MSADLESRIAELEHRVENISRRVNRGWLAWPSGWERGPLIDDWGDPNWQGPSDPLLADSDPAHCAGAAAGPSKGGTQGS